MINSSKLGNSDYNYQRGYELVSLASSIWQIIKACMSKNEKLQMVKIR